MPSPLKGNLLLPLIAGILLVMGLTYFNSTPQPSAATMFNIFVLSLGSGTLLIVGYWFISGWLFHRENEQQVKIDAHIVEVESDAGDGYADDDINNP